MNYDKIREAEQLMRQAGKILTDEALSTNTTSGYNGLFSVVRDLLDAVQGVTTVQPYPSVAFNGQGGTIATGNLQNLSPRYPVGVGGQGVVSMPGASEALPAVD